MESRRHSRGHILDSDSRLKPLVFTFQITNSNFRSLFCSKKSNVVATSKTELGFYLEESLFRRSESFDVLDWWKVNSAKQPTLAKIAHDTLAVLATSVASEANI
ncbi:unnamed protein product [Lactuca virosa]|uniref:HAT C-terminal dimerisation domain-containing protein n=1 Tax=Lactuca virosa TaxID=75947 RepID=A0AAU9NBF2_9ASTR|nr:unnamed protein product [Lactuca virosa]